MSQPVIPSKAPVSGIAEMHRTINYRPADSCETCRWFIYTEYHGFCGWVLKETEGKMKISIRRTYICDHFQAKEVVGG